MALGMMRASGDDAADGLQAHRHKRAGHQAPEARKERRHCGKAEAAPFEPRAADGVADDGNCVRIESTRPPA